ncbi:TraB/GumN family protein [Ornithinibacillus californiensis]|uniref:TraB/GumN family protein n=1 Tax=Ornithinibacillus californiensis TaxID=161536 RepID=UPI00064DAF67|nr:TraB/GumN family protein [Ornithinibacillus californiensis]
MKQWIQASMLILIILFLAACQSNEQAEAVYFSDYQLEQIIREEINRPEGDILKEDLLSITELNLSGKRIKSIDGLEYLDSVTTLNLQNNKIEDLSPLEKMDSLEQVNIGGNPYEQADLENLEASNITVITKVKVDIRGTEDGPGGYLWKVENGDTTVYLQGTIHIATDEFFPLNRKIEAAYAEADIIVPEIDLNNINVLEMQAMYMEYALYEDGSTIQDHIPTETFDELSSIYEDLGYSMDMFATYKPWFHSSLIQNLMNEELGYIDGVDLYFLNRAEHDQKEIIALETAEDQLSIFANVSPDYQIQMLEESIIELSEFESQMQEMFRLYLEGDGEALLDYLMVEGEEPTPEEQAYMVALNDNRNYQMAEQIANFLEEDSGDTYFVIVGSLHLLLEPHIRSILEEEGYTIEKVL